MPWPSKSQRYRERQDAAREQHYREQVEEEARLREKALLLFYELPGHLQEPNMMNYCIAVIRAIEEH